MLGAGVCGLVAAHRLARAGHAVDVYERWPGLGGQAATLDVGEGHRLERYYHHLFTSDRHIAELFEELGMPDAIEWRPSSVAFFARGRLHPFVTPLDLLRFRPLSPLARVRMGAAVLALQRFAGDPAPYEQVTARAWIERRMGRQAWEEVWGPLLRGKFGERADEIAMVWLWSKFRLRRSRPGRGRAPGAARLPARLVGAAARGAGALDRGRGRARADRPPGGARRPRRRRASPCTAAAAEAPSAAGTTRASSTRRRASATTACWRRCPTTSSSSCSTRRWRRRWGRSTSARARAIEYFAALCLLLELDRRVQPVLLDQRRRPRAPVRRADRAHQLRRAGALRRPPLPLRRQLPAARPRAARARRGRAARPLRAGPARGQPGLLARLGQARVAARRAGRAADRDRRLRRTASRRCARPAAGLVLANTTQVYPEDRGTNYAVRLGDQAARELLRD